MWCFIEIHGLKDNNTYSNRHVYLLKHSNIKVILCSLFNYEKSVIHNSNASSKKFKINNY